MKSFFVGFSIGLVIFALLAILSGCSSGPKVRRTCYQYSNYRNTNMESNCE